MNPAFNNYLKTKFKEKEILVDCFNMKQVKGILKKIHPTFIILENRNLPIAVQINSIAFVQEVEE